MVRIFDQSSVAGGLFLQERFLSCPDLGVALESYFAPGAVEDPSRADDRNIIILPDEDSKGDIHLVSSDGVPEPWVKGETPLLLDCYGQALSWGQIPFEVYAQALLEHTDKNLPFLVDAATNLYRSYLASQGIDWADKDSRYLYGGACIAHIRISEELVETFALGDCVWAVRLRSGEILSSEDWVYPAQKIADFLLKELDPDQKEARRVFNRIFKPWQRGHLANHVGGNPEAEKWNEFCSQIIQAVSGGADHMTRTATVKQLLDQLLKFMQGHSYLFFDGAELPPELCQYQSWPRERVSDVLVCSDGAFLRSWGEIPNGIGVNLLSLIDEGGVEAVRVATEQRARKSPDHTGPVGPESCLVYCKLH